MRDEYTYAPLVSKKGQTNWTIDFIHGAGTALSGAISNKMYLYGSLNYFRSKNSHSAQSSVTNQMNNVGGTTTSSYPYSSTVSYDLNYLLQGIALTTGAGFYKPIGNAGRWEYGGGFTRGNVNNKYTYEFSSVQQYSFKEIRNYNQYFLQSDIGFVTARYEGAVIVKASMIHFTSQKFENDYPVNGYTMRTDQYVLQPAFRLGCGNICRLYVQCGWNIELNKGIDWYKTNVQAGLIFRFNEKSIDKF
jgi:hypothetical protein